MSSKTGKLTLVKNKKLDCIYHKESMLVFNSATEKLVIGRIENDEIIPLDERALELCQEHGFKYDESLVETEEAGSQEADSQNNDHEENSVAQPTQPVAQPSQPVAQPSQPVAQTAQSVGQPTQPVGQSTQPVTQPTQPVTQPTQPLAQPTQPVGQPTQSVGQNSTTDITVIKEFEHMVNSDAESLVNYFKSTITGNLVSYFKTQVEAYSDRLQKSNDRISELEAQLALSRKELDETKKKMRGILAAIQADL